MKRLTLLILMLFCFAYTFAQDPIAPPSYDRGDIIFGEYKWIYDKKEHYDSKRGISKGGKILLPAIFHAYNDANRRNYDNISKYYKKGQDKKRPILGLGAYYGLYNIEVEQWDIPLMYSRLYPVGGNIYIAHKGRNLGIVDGNNNVIADFEWKHIKPVRDAENYLYVTDFSTPPMQGVFSALAGKLVIPPKYLSVRKISNKNKFIATNNSNERNIIDTKGKTLFNNWYTKLITREDSELFIVEKDGKMGIIDENEKAIIPIEYQSISPPAYEDGSYLAQNKEGKYGFMTIEGKVTLPFVYDTIEVQRNLNSIFKGKTIANSLQGDKCGIIRMNDGLPYEIATCDYDNIERREKFLVVKQGEKYGIMNMKGEMQTDMKYDKIKWLAIDLLAVVQSKKHYLIDSDGNLVNDNAYQDIDFISVAGKSLYYSVSRQLSLYLKVKQKGKYGIIDKRGNAIIPPTFEDILSESQNIISAKKNGKIGLYDILAKSDITPYEYDKIILSNEEYYGLKGNDIYLITPKGKTKVTKL